MIIGPDGAWLFIAVPKTGTSSIESMLQTHGDEALSARWNKHVLAMKLRDELDEGLWQRAYKFAFVREPYQWMFSWYRYRQRDALKDPKHPHHHRYTGAMSFDDFVASFRDGELMLRQCDFLESREGDLLVDFVGRFESLQTDYDRLQCKLGLPKGALPRVNSSGAGIASLPMSADSRRIIQEYFARDFERFDYAP